MKRRAVMTLLAGGFVSLLLNAFAGKDEDTAKLIRPPGSQDEAVFLATCLRCGKCAQVCPHNAIKIVGSEYGLSLGTPCVIPREAACQLCLDCAKACPSGALRPIAGTDKKNVRMGTASINRDNCLAWQGEECKICYTSCPFFNQAIKLENHKQPVVDANICVGCGICEYVCMAEPAAAKVKARG